MRNWSGLRARQGAGPALPRWMGRDGSSYAPWPQRAEWAGRMFHLGKNREVSGAEPYAPYRALEVFEERKENGRRYTAFTDSTAATARARSDGTGPGRRIVIATIEVCERLLRSGDEATIGRVASHLGIEGGEIADEWAKMAETKEYLRETSLAPIARMATH